VIRMGRGDASDHYACVRRAGCGAVGRRSYFSGARHAELSRETSRRISGFFFRCLSVSCRMLAAALSLGVASR